MAINVLTILLLNNAPVQATESKDQAQKAGKEHYNSYCISCHGINMVNIGTRSFDLRKFPLNDRARFVKSVKDGKKSMPAWKDVLGDDAIRQLWEYVKTRGKS
ncbi:MAG: cytochrome c [Sneathiella sp.]|nr:cytochrome c [Sneathiella sp.]